MQGRFWRRSVDRMLHTPATRISIETLKTQVVAPRRDREHAPAVSGDSSHGGALFERDRTDEPASRAAAVLFAPQRGCADLFRSLDGDGSADGVPAIGQRYGTLWFGCGAGGGLKGLLLGRPAGARRNLRRFLPELAALFCHQPADDLRQAQCAGTGVVAVGEHQVEFGPALAALAQGQRL